LVPETKNQEGKTNLDLLQQLTVSGSGISWAICKSAPRPRQITTLASHHSVFIGWMPFLPPNQQRQSTEGKTLATLFTTAMNFLLFSTVYNSSGSRSNM